MAKATRLSFGLVLALSLAAPSLAGAQAVPRPAGGSSAGSSGSSGSGGSSSSGSTSSGGSEGTRVGPSGGGSSSRVGGSDVGSRAPSRRPSDGRTGTPIAVRRGPDTTAPAPGGVLSGGSSTSAQMPLGVGSSAISRDRNGRPVTGIATQRQPLSADDIRLISFPLYGPWGGWYPWYGGLGSNYRFYTYNPWRYGATGWMMGRYGVWYDPYGYYPYDPYYYPYGDWYYGGSYREEEPAGVRTGSIRLKVNPSSARVYIDGALVGVADDFDGLSDHLEIEAGAHELELRADGYQTLTTTIKVEAGKTRTERLSLKKK